MASSSASAQVTYLKAVVKVVHLNALAFKGAKNRHTRTDHAIIWGHQGYLARVARLRTFKTDQDAEQLVTNLAVQSSAVHVVSNILPLWWK